MKYVFVDWGACAYASKTHQDSLHGKGEEITFIGINWIWDIPIVPLQFAPWSIETFNLLLKKMISNNINLRTDWGLTDSPRFTVQLEWRDTAFCIGSVIIYYNPTGNLIHPFEWMTLLFWGVFFAEIGKFSVCSDPRNKTVICSLKGVEVISLSVSQEMTRNFNQAEREHFSVMDSF